uniref:SAM domain-containing protein n=1 Tax=Panagrolaimus sp. ES5 TaxID=591445 RepID=A0AC34FKG6_9BILA
MFQNLTYDEMMNLNERQLEMLKVTKGARKKILQSLEKLRERVSTIKMLDKIIDVKGDLTFTVSEIRLMMNTPICSYKPMEREMLDASAVDGIDVSIDKISELNLPGHIIHITSRIHDILFEHGKIYDLEDEYLLKLLQIYEKICSHDSFNSKQRTCATTWKRTLRKVAVERNLLPPGNGHIGVGYAGFKRSGYTQQRMSSSTTRSSTTSPPESSCAISPPPMMPQSYSAPPYSSNSSSSTASISHFPIDKLREHPQGAALLQQLVELTLQLQEDQKNEMNTVPPHRYGGTQTPPGVSKERISISKSLSSPDNSRLNKPLTQEEMNAFMNQCRQDGHLTSALPPTPPNWIPNEATTSRYHTRPYPGMTQHSSMPSTTQWPYHNNNNNNNNNSHASLPPQMIQHHHHHHQQQHLPPSTTSTTTANALPTTSLETRRTCYPYTGRQSLSARIPSSLNSSGFSSGGSDRSSGAGSPTSSTPLLPFPTKWPSVQHHHQGSYNAEMCNNQNMPPVK